MRHLAWLVLIVALLAGCLSASPSADDAGGQLGEAPAEESVSVLPDRITGYEEAATLELDGSGTGSWIDEADDLLYAGRGGGGLAIVDVSDPAAPKEVATIAEQPDGDNLYVRDVDLMELRNRTIAVGAGGGQGIHLVDVTDPASPEVLSTTPMPGGTTAHNVAVVPGTGLIYNSGAGPANGATGQGLIYGLDANDPKKPEIFSFTIPKTVNDVPVTSDGCHDVVVRTDLGRAYCAGGGSMYAQGGGETFIWDISESIKRPAWIGVVDHPSIVYHHQAFASEDGNLLLINDEFIAPNCQTGQVGPVGYKQSTAAVWIFDISDPQNPKKMGYVQADEPVGPDGPVNCGSHFGDPVDGRDVATWGWYSGGTMLIDYAEPDQPRILDRKMGVGSVWDARYHAGHAFANGGNLQVLELV